ncbi:hypothetical protein [Pseudofrankia sp. BMG5.37]|uniref:hypothetical protein n=1 Tax=Pseudofrankia sp. BMG5.37 TaxID=3050035 RepID=UPI002895F66E|nr:hypothetical protein [Pseudofrankia sp. BMG5.37]MDT3438362.1 hypothetical protein [Pseudofrankia sp. BMG5.37]
MTARREWSREELRAYAREIAAKAPPFTPAQIVRLRRLLGTDGPGPALAVRIRPAERPPEDIISAA